MIQRLKLKPLLAFALLALAFAGSARAELTIEITRGSDNPVPIAIVPFGWPQGGTVPPEDVASIIEADLKLSGEFAPMPRENMLGMPESSTDVFYRDWRSLGMDYLLVGKLEVRGRGVRAQYELLDANTQQVILTGSETAKLDDIRGVAHAVSDAVYEKLTNVRGAFSTKLLYVSARRNQRNQFRYSLLTSDIDGARERVILDQSEPIMTPAWSPDGQNIAYVSFESRRPAVYIQNLRNNKRKRVTYYKGINGAPSWSPDGRKLALVLSKDGSPDIYVLDVRANKIKRITRHFAIDTEPSWMPDGKSLVFTSDRGGKPQIYQVSLVTGKVERLTFEGDYNARARVLPDGNGFVMVHRSKGKYHIGIQDMRRRTFEVLTDTALDESPSIAPNGSMLLYATMHKGRGVLAAVSLDGTISYRLPSLYGDVREPAWSPFID